MKITYTVQNIEQSPVEIEANLDFPTQTEDAVWLLWAFAPLQASAEKAGRSESERLGKIVSELETSLELSHGVDYAGMRIQDGWAEFYFYAVFSKGAERRFREVFLGHGYPQIEFGVNRDADHHFYHEQLAPDATAIQQAKNAQIIEELSTAGDTLESVRPVEHYLFFQTRSAMLRTADALEARGKIEKDLYEEGTYPHGLMLIVEHACTADAVGSVTSALIEAVEAAHGIYVGWSTAMAEKGAE